MKYWSILFLTLFISLTALPSVAMVFDWDLPSMKIAANEDSETGETASFKEEIASLPLEIQDFWNPPSYRTHFKILFVNRDDSIHLSPYIAVFSPPPEA